MTVVPQNHTGPVASASARDRELQASVFRQADLHRASAFNGFLPVSAKDFDHVFTGGGQTLRTAGDLCDLSVCGFYIKLHIFVRDMAVGMHQTDRIVAVCDGTEASRIRKSFFHIRLIY